MKYVKFSKDRLAQAFQTRSFFSGGYSSLILAVVIAIAVIVNLAAGQLPSTATKLDMTATGLYQLSDQTETVVSQLTEPVEIYLLAQQGSEDSTLLQFLDRYESLSDQIHVKTVDPVTHPNFASQYTSDSLYNNSLLVVSGDRSRYISYYDIYQTSYTDPYSYQGTVEFIGEGSLTNAIDYVTNLQLPQVYVLTGHGEQALDGSLQTAIAKENISLVEEFSLLAVDQVPQDADAILIFGPQSDLSESDADKLLTYLQQGGKLLLFTDDTEEILPNLMSVLAHYDVAANKGIVLEGDDSAYFQYPAYILPTLADHAITSPLSEGGYYAMTPFAQSIITTSDSHRDGLTVTNLLTTSSQAYLKEDGYQMTTLDREDGDPSGIYTLGVAIEEVLADDDSEDHVSENGGNNRRSTQIVWIGSTQMFQSQVDAVVSGGNSNVFLNSLGWVCQKANSLTIRGKSLEQAQLLVPASKATLLSVVFVAIIPLGFLVAGVIIWRRRRAR